MTRSRHSAVIAVDWGTSSFRAYRLDDAGQVRQRLAAPMGILRVEDRDFAAALETQIGGWARDRPHAPIVMSGMIGSRQGWVETPYLPCPAGLDEIAAAMVRTPWRDGREVWIAPGLACRGEGGVPDVMRGEEVQILGALDALGPGRHRLCLPGTHSKWARVEDGRILAFRTHMTGEVYEVLRGHSILGRLMAKAEGEGEADGERWFDEGLSRAEAAGGLLHHLFGVRARGLMAEVPAEGLGAYLSGLLIGHEVAAACANLAGKVHILGARRLSARYGAALARRGLAVVELDPEAVATGLSHLAARLPGPE